ncbi:hypothetical protein HDU81_003520 [Chytriomyces hyalinus]|nr:hypothetical protein HDU81_003520 [Chytriomyces hyalinus]
MSPRVAQQPSWHDHLSSSVVVRGDTDAPGSRKENKSQRISWEPTATSESSRPAIALSADPFSCPDPSPNTRNTLSLSSAQTESLESNPALLACATTDKLALNHVSPLLSQAANLIRSNLSSATANPQLLLPILDSVSAHVNPTLLTQKSASIHFLRYSAICFLVQNSFIASENGFLDPLFHLLDFDAMSISELEAIGSHDVVPVSILINALMHRVKLHADPRSEQQDLVDPLNACSAVFNDDLDLVDGILLPEAVSTSKTVLPELVQDIPLFRSDESDLPLVDAVPENHDVTDESSDSGSEAKSSSEFKSIDDEMDESETRGRSRLRTFGTRTNKRVSAVVQPTRVATRRKKKYVKPAKQFAEELPENDANFSVDINELLEATRPVFIELKPLSGCKPAADSIENEVDFTSSLPSSQETASEMPPLFFPTSVRPGCSPVLEFKQSVAFNESCTSNTSLMSSSYEEFAVSASPAAEMASYDESTISLQESTGILEGSLDLEYLAPASPEADQSDCAIALDPIEFKEPISSDYWDEESHLDTMHPTQMSTLKLLDSVNDKLFKILAEERDEVPALDAPIFSKVNALDDAQESPIQSTNRLQERALRGTSPRLKQKPSSGFFLEPQTSYSGNKMRGVSFKGASPTTVEHVHKVKLAQQAMPHKEMEQRWLTDQDAIFVDDCQVGGSATMPHGDTRGPVSDKKKNNRTAQKEPWQSAFSSAALPSSFLKGPPPRVNRMERRASLQLMMQQPYVDSDRQVLGLPSRQAQQSSRCILV